MTICVNLTSVVITFMVLSYFYIIDAGEVPVVNTCPSELSGNVIAFRVDECNRFPCTVRREMRYHASFSFSPAKEAPFFRIRCGTLYLGRPQTLRDISACDHLSEGKCPFVVGQNYTYATSFKIPYYVPPTTYSIACQMVDEDGKYLMCGTGSVRLV